MPPDPTIALHLIQQVAKQDRDAFSQLYDRFSTLVFTLAMRMLKARSDAEDLLQEVFVQVWRQAENYSAERGSPEAWISAGVERRSWGPRQELGARSCNRTLSQCETRPPRRTTTIACSVFRSADSGAARVTRRKIRVVGGALR